MSVLIVRVHRPDADEYGTDCECMILDAVMASKQFTAPPDCRPAGRPQKTIDFAKEGGIDYRPSERDNTSHRDGRRSR
jgi:hypothetical protein